MLCIDAYQNRWQRSEVGTTKEGGDPLSMTFTANLYKGRCETFKEIGGGSSQNCVTKIALELWQFKNNNMILNYPKQFRVSKSN